MELMRRCAYAFSAIAAARFVPSLVFGTSDACRPRDRALGQRLIKACAVVYAMMRLHRNNLRAGTGLPNRGYAIFRSIFSNLQRASVAGIPLATLTALLLAALSNLRRERAYLKSTADTALRGILAAFVPIKVAQGLHDPEDADLIALAAMVLGVFMGHRSAAAIILLMITGGEALEEYALQRAGSAMEAAINLRRRLPETVTRIAQDGANDGDAAAACGTLVCAEDVATCALGDVKVDDVLLIKEGDMVPVDCIVRSMVLVDESAVTGERGVRQRDAGDALLSGSIVLSRGGPRHALLKMPRTLHLYC